MLESPAADHTCYAKQHDNSLPLGLPCTVLWNVLVGPPNSQGTSLLLAQASTPEQASRIGNQTGGRVFLFLHTDDCWRDYREMKARDVKFSEAPREETYGTVAVFEDLYGNKWDLLELKDNSGSV